MGYTKPLTVATWRKGAEAPRADAAKYNRMLQAAAFSIAIGIAHPFFTELSKSAHLWEYERDVSGAWVGRDLGRRVMPFHIITLSLTSQIVSVLIAVAVITAKNGVQGACAELLNFRTQELMPILIIGMIYGFGDFLQTTACNKSSAPVVLLIGQSKLFLSALMSRFFLRTGATTNWLRLITISLAACASAEISAAASLGERSEEMLGAMLAFLKAVLSTAGAVASERVFKSQDAGFWLVSFRVQLGMLLTSLAVIAASGSAGEVWSSGYFGGPLPRCSDMTCLDERCVCTSSSGWDWMTVLAMLALVLNGYASGFLLKHLSAVCKAVCSLASSGLCCVACWLLGLAECSPGQAFVALIVLVQSYEYAEEKARAPRMEAVTNLDIQKESWVQHYQCEEGRKDE